MYQSTKLNSSCFQNTAPVINKYFLQKEMQCYQNTKFRHESLDGTGQYIVGVFNLKWRGAE